MAENTGDGKKIFLLHPQSVIHQDMLDVLIMAGYETYIILDADRARKLLKKFPGSIMYINIDERFREAEWETYIRNILDDDETKDSMLGILSYNQDKALMKKYLMDLALPCGYVQLKLGIKESTKIILNALETTEARGRRKSIRADCADDINATINIKGNTGFINGKLLDISSAGIAANFDTFEDHAPNTLLNDIQLRLRTGLIRSDMVYMGKRMDKKHVYIMLFEPKMSHENKLTIYRYVKSCLQKYIDTIHV